MYPVQTRDNYLILTPDGVGSTYLQRALTVHLQCAEFINGADPHPDMFTKEFGQFIFNGGYTNRAGHHMNQEANKIYADYFYNQWKIKNES